MSMEPNCINFLTIIPKKEIIKFGIPYLKMVIKSMLDFKKSIVKNGIFGLILRDFSVTTWNIHNKKTNGYSNIHNRTNNRLER